ncbi:MAG: restriction endonuclease [Desulfobacteraceae bacterium 4572_35.1]|nr:MAG: restriction endonuclease [Desulfobacteraceae bacterium 4572_35.1]
MKIAGVTCPRVSAHGGHSGEFCLHAKDNLADIVATYAQQGFSWIGLTEHMPPPVDDKLYPDEQQAGLKAVDLLRQFDRYVQTARRLQQQYAGEMTIYVSMESEFYAGAVPWVRQLQRQYNLDYLVGSVHHVNECCFDFSVTEYQYAIEVAGGLDAAYCNYFDAQYAMIEHLRPAVVGHFDLIRLFDDDYPRRMQQPQVAQRIERNLQRIAQLGLMLDFNVRALLKGATEPYVTAPILQRALELEIDIVPGDDSHGVSSVGVGLDSAIKLLHDAGCPCQWRKPVKQS